MSDERLTPNQKLSVGYIILRNKAPYLQTLLHTLVSVETPGMGTMGVSDRLILYWDPEFVTKLDKEEVAAVLMHELMHIMQRHSDRFKKYVLGRSDLSLQEVKKTLGKEYSKMMMLFNVAGDMEINDDIKATKIFKLPEMCVLPGSCGFEENLLAEEYFKKLLEQDEKNKQEGKGGNGDENDEPQVTSGRCGSCSGNPNEQEDDSVEAKEGRTDGELERALNETAESVKEQAGKNAGSIPGSLIRWAEERIKPPKIRWQDKLARVLRHSVNKKRGMMDYDKKRMSRRQWGIGVGPGIPILPGMSSPIPVVWFAIDTSGSMSKSELERSVSEADAVLKALGTPVRFIACDYSIGANKKVSSWRDIAKNLVGGGGTSFMPVFDAMNNSPEKPDILIFATDGCGQAPSQPPGLTKVIWILTGPYRSKPFTSNGDSTVTYGEFIEVDD